MIIIKLFGGLGNQMFQYAHACSISIKYQIPIYFDTRFLNVKNIETPRTFRLDTFGIRNKIACTKDLHFFYSLKGRLLNKINSYLLSINARLIIRKFYLTSFMQGECCFENNSEYIKKIFSLENRVSLPDDHLLNSIRSIDDSVSIHIRRGDYKNNYLHDICHREYFFRAIEIMNLKLDYPIFFIFSDEIELAKEMLHGQENCIFANSMDTDINHLYQISQCKHSIISNSSFSWWGAWLKKENPDNFTIAPNKWVSDIKMNNFYVNKCKLIPSNWITINV